MTKNNLEMLFVLFVLFECHQFLKWLPLLKCATSSAQFVDFTMCVPEVAVRVRPASLRLSQRNLCHNRQSHLFLQRNTGKIKNSSHSRLSSPAKCSICNFRRTSTQKITTRGTWTLGSPTGLQLCYLPGPNAGGFQATKQVLHLKEWWPKALWAKQITEKLKKINRWISSENWRFIPRETIGFSWKSEHPLGKPWSTTPPLSFHDQNLHYWSSGSFADNSSSLHGDARHRAAARSWVSLWCQEL